MLKQNSNQTRPPLLKNKLLITQTRAMWACGQGGVLVNVIDFCGVMYCFLLNANQPIRGQHFSLGYIK